MGAFQHLPKFVLELQIAWNSKFFVTTPWYPLRKTYSASRTPSLHWCLLRSQLFGQRQNVLWHVCNVFVFIWKQYPEYFPFLILRILELFTHKVNFSKHRLIFTLFYCFSMSVNKLFKCSKNLWNLPTRVSIINRSDIWLWLISSFSSFS